MDHTLRIRALNCLAGIILAAGLTGPFGPPAALADGQQYFRGVIQLADRSLCWYKNPFFNKWVYPLVEQVDAAGTVIGPPSPEAGTQLGLFTVLLTPTVGTKLRVTCESVVTEHVLSAADFSPTLIDIVLPNHKPVATDFRASLNGQLVQGVPAGATVSVTVSATDPDGDLLHFAWAATDGITTNTNGPQATWTLPASRGLHFLYVLVSDGKGGYEEKQLALSTDAGVVPVGGVFHLFLPLIAQFLGPALAALTQPSDHVPAGSHFLTFASVDQVGPARGAGGPPDNRVSACAYYRDLGAVGGCTPAGVPTGVQLTFQNWKQSWGFGTSSNEASALYANLVDLNLQRDMHSLSRLATRPGGGTGTDVASYVCNYPNPAADVTLSNVRLGNNLVACVAFEYSVTNNRQTGLPYSGGQPFTKFLTFGPTGNLLLSVNLDGRGEKFIPGTCVACHGGHYSGQYGLYQSTTPDLLSKFIPYDLDNYRFSTLAGLQRADQEASLRALNQFVLLTNPYTPTVELINGWYPTPSSSHTGTFVPPGWQGHEDLYRAVVKPYCRMCHVALDAAPVPYNVPFNTFANFAFVSADIARDACGVVQNQRYNFEMPNAKVTFDRFWNSIGNPPGVNAPAKLAEFVMAQGVKDQNGNLVTQCALPSWLP